MKNIKLMLTAFAAVLLMSSTTFAQRTGQNPERADRMAQMIAEKLDLSDEQTNQIKAIHQEFSKKMSALRSTSNGDREVMKETIQKLKVEKDTAIEKVLSKEQMAKWETLKTERTTRPKMERPQGKRPTMNAVKGVERPTKNEKGESVKGVKRPQVERPQGKRPTMNTKVERPQKPRGKKGNRMQQALGLSESQATELKKITKAHLAKMKELKANGARKGKIKRAYKKHKAAVKKLLTPEQFEKWTAIKAEKKVKRDILK